MRNINISLFPICRWQPPIGNAAYTVAVQGDDAGKDQDTAGQKTKGQALAHEQDSEQGREQDFAYQEKPTFPAFAVMKPLVHQKLPEDRSHGDPFF